MRMPETAAGAAAAKGANGAASGADAESAAADGAGAAGDPGPAGRPAASRPAASRPADDGAPDGGAPAGETPGSRGGQLGTRILARLRPAYLGGLARQHWLATALLAAGLGLRVIAQFAYGPALLYIDSVKYLYGAWPGADPLGYDVPLKLILAVGDLSAVEVVQHLLGLAMGVTLYVVLLRRGVPRWLAALSMAPILLDAYQLQMETTIMPDVWFEAVIVAGLAILLWRPRVSFWSCVLAGVVLGLGATVRQIGEILIVPALIFVLAGALLARQGGWRQALRKGAAMSIAFALPILAYCSGSYIITGNFWLSRNGYQATYGRLAAVADCTTLKLPSYERPLCPTPAQQAKGPDWLDHSVYSPLRTYVLPASAPVGHGQAVANFNHRVITQQTVRVTGRIIFDADKLFAVTRDTSPGDTPISRWQFHTTYPIYLPTIRLDKAHTIILDLKLGPADGASIYRKLDTAYGGNASVWHPGAAFLRRYQVYGGYTPGPLLLLCLLAGLAGTLTVFRRRAAQAQRQLALGATVFTTAAVAVLLMSDLFEFSWRYQLPALVTLPPAAAFGLAAMLRYTRRRKTERIAAAAGPRERVAAGTR
jgi:hypothetical protein